MVCYNILCTQAETKGDDEEETAAGDEEVRFNIYFSLVIHSLDLNISSLYCQSDISYKDSSKNLDFNQTLCLPTDIFLSSQTHSSWNCVDMVRQNLFLVTLSWSLRVNYNYNNYAETAKSKIKLCILTIFICFLLSGWREKWRRGRKEGE